MPIEAVVSNTARAASTSGPEVMLAARIKASRASLLIAFSRPCRMSLPIVD
jgi:hypothetical protein